MYLFFNHYFIKTNEMNKIIILILCLCCAFDRSRGLEEGPALNPSDANIVGHDGGPENRRTFVLYYDLFERDDYRDFD